MMIESKKVLLTYRLDQSTLRLLDYVLLSEKKKSMGPCLLSCGMAMIYCPLRTRVKLWLTPHANGVLAMTTIQKIITCGLLSIIED